MDDTRDIDSIINALYETISGEAGEPRDWERSRALFFPGARQIRTVVGPDGRPGARAFGVEEYIADVRDYFDREGFYEWEVARRTERFGQIAHAFSAYEARRARHDERPFKRGINSIQLFHDGDRWWIVNMIWDNEREGNPLPEEFSPAPATG